MAAAPSRRALVVHPGSLGDVLLARPALHALRHGPAPLDLVLLANREVGALLREAGEVQEVWALEGGLLAGLLSGASSADDPRWSLVQDCAIAVGWLADRENRLRAPLERLGVEVIVLASPHVQARPVVHQAERFLETIQTLPIGDAQCGSLRLPPACVEEGRDRMARLLDRSGGPVVVLHPGSGSREKCCRPSRLAEVVETVRRGGMTPLLVGGPADESVLVELRALLHASVPIVDGLSLRSLAGLLAAADVYLGHDSGVTHLAAAVGIPVVALFGPTDARRWAPRGPRVRILSGGPCRCAGWEAVRSCPDKPCLNLSPDLVVSACHDLAGPVREAAGTTPGSGPRLVVPTRLC